MTSADREAELFRLNCLELDLYLEQRVLYRRLVAMGSHAYRGVPVPQKPRCLADPHRREKAHDVMEPLIPVELYEAVQRTLCKDGKRQGRRSQHFLLAGGLLRCGCCGYAMSVRRAETPAGLREHYRCMGRRSGAAECKQSDVPREPIDRAVLEYFAQVALDVEGTIDQLTGERAVGWPPSTRSWRTLAASRPTRSGSSSVSTGFSGTRA